MTRKPDPDLAAIDAALGAPPNPLASEMTLWDHFAGQALITALYGDDGTDAAQQIAQACYRVADAMLVARHAARAVCLALALLTLPAICSAQTTPQPEPTGMSRWAFWFAESGQIADLVTTEIAEAHGVHEANVLMKYRAVRIPLKVLLPIATRYAFKDKPRAQANHRAIFLSALGFGMSAVNVSLTVAWGK